MSPCQAVVTGSSRWSTGNSPIVCKKSRSKYNYFLGISYPNDEDALDALKSDLISVKEFILIDSAIRKGERPPWNTKLGGNIGIHGTGNDKILQSSMNINWTDGCIALPDDVMEIVYNLAEIGTPVTIFP